MQPYVQWASCQSQASSILLQQTPRTVSEPVYVCQVLRRHLLSNRKGGLGIWYLFFLPVPTLFSSAILNCRTEHSTKKPNQEENSNVVFFYVSLSKVLIFFLFSLKQSFLLGLTPFCTGCDQKAMQSARDPRASNKLHCLPSLLYYEECRHPTSLQLTLHMR